MAKKANGYKWAIGILTALLVALVVLVICYFAIPSFNQAVNDFAQKINDRLNSPGETEEAAEAVKMLMMR